MWRNACHACAGRQAGRPGPAQQRGPAHAHATAPRHAMHSPACPAGNTLYSRSDNVQRTTPTLSISRHRIVLPCTTCLLLIIEASEVTKLSRPTGEPLKVARPSRPSLSARAQDGWDTTEDALSATVGAGTHARGHATTVANLQPVTIIIAASTQQHPQPCAPLMLSMSEVKRVHSSSSSGIALPSLGRFSFAGWRTPSHSK